MLFSSPGATTTLLWSYVRCADDEFSVFSGVDTVTCQSCPSGADCSGSTLVSSLLANAAGSTNGSGSVTAAVVVQQSITAQPGYWASSDSDGLTFYACPNPNACLPGVNGTRSQCATGYTGVLCTVCSPGYFNQYGLCAQCR